MLLDSVVQTSRALAATSKRLAKIELLGTHLRQLSGNEAAVVSAWLSGTSLQGRIGIGYAVIRDSSAAPASQPSLNILDVDHAFDQLAAVRGAGSDTRRREQLHALFARATEDEQRFLVGVLGGELRQGALEGIMLEAMAKAAQLPLERVRRAAMMAGSAAAIARPLLEEGDAALARYDIQLFRPVQPMLAQTAETAADALAELGEAALEYKFDGARVQVHKSGDRIAVYSRALNEVTDAVPEIVAGIRQLPVHDLILDGEVLGFDETGRPLPFQMSMRRFGRKANTHDPVDEARMQPFWFDLLYAGGTSLIDEPQSRRFDELRAIVPAHQLVPQLVTADPLSAQEFVAEALNRGHEGVMAKLPSAPYAAGGRGQSWLKIKQARTLDLVILAAEWGNGRRTGLLSNLHLGAPDTEKGGFAMLGKTFKGLTDEMLAWQTEQFLAREIGRDGHTVYVKPELVAEIAFNEIQVSSRYVSGLALRFARVKRYRSDKAAAQADTFQTVQRLAGLRS